LQNFISQKEQFSPSNNSFPEQLRETFDGICFEIDIESWWVCRHIKLSSDLKQNATEVETQFDMAVNPL
jgi:hypothetical protein